MGVGGMMQIDDHYLRTKCGDKLAIYCQDWSDVFGEDSHAKLILKDFMFRARCSLIPWEDVIGVESALTFSTSFIDSIKDEPNTSYQLRYSHRKLS